ncbi:MAG: organomercurial lyase MerB [Chloroflexota bacterium]|nr:organomercurial lyase MerB [Chloroflexota bacterium]
MPGTHSVLDEAAVLLGEQVEIWRRLVHPTIVLLAGGRPVEPAEVAAVSGVPLDQVDAALATMADVEWDDEGRIVGMGLTQRPTQHRMRIGDKTLYAWCAMDTLAFAAILDRRLTIESADHASGEPIRIEVDGRRVLRAEPASAVVSWWVKASGEGVRDKLCNHGHFFTSRESAAGWLADRPGGHVLSLDEAFAAGRRMASEVLDES